MTIITQQQPSLQQPSINNDLYQPPTPPALAIMPVDSDSWWNQLDRDEQFILQMEADMDAYHCNSSALY